MSGARCQAGYAMRRAERGERAKVKAGGGGMATEWRMEGKEGEKTKLKVREVRGGEKIRLRT